MRETANGTGIPMKTLAKWLILPLILAAGLAFAETNEEAGIPKYYGKELCHYKGFTCKAVKKGDTWAKRFPNARERELVKRLNRTNMALSYRKWIVVPDDLKNLDLMDLSPFPAKVNPPGNKLIVINLKVHAFGAYDPEGNLVHWGPVSGGHDWCDDINGPCNTKSGSFKIIDRQGEKCKSSAFPVETSGGAPMPYCMHFYRGFALHASNELPGFHASHGCLRLFFEDAKWLNKEFVTVGTLVIVMR
jgi:L,D-transpeptidase ErfK/SrfK